MDNFESMQSENLELFKRAISEAMDLKIQEIDEQISNVELPPLSKDYKARMNRLFREHNSGSPCHFQKKTAFKIFLSKNKNTRIATMLLVFIVY